MTAQRGYAWRRLPCGHAIVWDGRLGPMAPCRECDAAGWRAWAVGCGLVNTMEATR